MTSPRPGYRIVLDGQDITPRINGRLQKLSLTDSRGDEADQLDLTLTDHDGQLEIPRKGVELELAIGWVAEGLVDRGLYVVDEVEHSGTPDQLTVRARSADLTGDLAAKRSHSWHGQSIDAIVTTIAKRHGLQPRVGDALAPTAIAHIDQTEESDISFLTRLGERYDAIATVKAGRLLFIRAGEGETASGAPIEPVTLTRGDGDSHRYRERDRDSHTGVRAHWNDLSYARKRAVIVGKEENLKTLRQSYGSEADALAAARSEWRRIRRGVASLSYNLARGRADLYPETPIRVSGIKPPIDRREWLTKKVSHSLSDSGYTASLELETKGGE